MEPEDKKTLILLTIIVGSLVFYLGMTNYIETEKLYPQQLEEWFTFNLADYGNNRSCIEIREINAYYYNDLSNARYVLSNKEPNLLELQIPLSRKCDFGEAKIQISVTDLDFPIALIDDLNMSWMNRTGNESFSIILTNSSELGSQVINVIMPIKRDFYNYYRLNSREGINFNVLSFRFKNSVLGGYLADGSSFVVFDNPPKDERPIFSGKYKWFMFDNSSILFRFNPRSKPWFLLQKILDTLILGIIVVALYDLPWRNLKKLIKKISKRLKGYLHSNTMLQEQNQKLIRDKGPEKGFDKLWVRLNEIEQEVNLGTFDNIIVASMFLIIAVSISVLLWSLSNYHNSIFYLIIAAVLLLFLYNFSQLTLGFLNSVIFKDKRFTNKINVITILLSLFLFITLVVGVPLGLEKIFPLLDQNSPSVFYSIFLVVLVLPIVFGVYIRPRVTKFFVENFPHLFLRGLNKMENKQRENALKKIKKTLPELKELAKKY